MGRPPPRGLASTVEERDRVRAELEVAGREARSWDVLAWADGDVGVAETAKNLSRDLGIKIGRNRLFTLLSDYGWI